MKKKGGMLLTFPLMCGFVYLMGAPVLAWIRTMLPGFPAWLFWPVAALLMSAVTLSYLLPYGRLSSSLHILGEAVMAPMLTLSALLIPLDIVWLFWREMPVFETGWVVFAIYALLVGIGLRNGSRIRRREYRLRFAKPFPALRIALVSDLHLGAFSGRGMMKRIVDALLACKPDFVVMAGDLFDDRLADFRHPDEALREFGRLTQHCPVFACEGNHDLFEKDNPKREAFIERAGIRWLRDELVSYAGLTLAFRKDLRDESRLPPERLFARAKSDLPLVAVDHNPKEIEALWASGADLVLSGHTHGGQTFPANLLYRLGRLFCYGCRQQGGRYAIVTSGAGAYGTPIRLGVPNEVVLLHTGP